VLLHQLPRRGHPRCCTTQCEEASVSSVTLCRLLFVWLTRQALKGGTAEPSKGNKYVFCDYAGVRRDVGPAGTIHSVAISPVRPSPPLHHHAGRCGDIPDAVEAQGDRTSSHPPLCLVRPPVDSIVESARGRWPDTNPYDYYPRSRSCTCTRLATTPQQERDSLGWSSTPRHCSPYLYT
jgi:hypothetical protein